jgi:hypothetical protein
MIITDGLMCTVLVREEAAETIHLSSLLSDISKNANYTPDI